MEGTCEERQKKKPGDRKFKEGAGREEGTRGRVHVHCSGRNSEGSEKREECRGVGIGGLPSEGRERRRRGGECG